MRTIYFHLGLSLFLAFTTVAKVECQNANLPVLAQMVETLWVRLERIWESSLLAGPLKFLTELPIFKITRAAVRFTIGTILKLPFDALLKVFDFVCDTLTTEGIIGKPGLIAPRDLGLSLIDDEGREYISLLKLATIKDSVKFFPDKDLVIFIPSLSREDRSFDPVTDVLAKAFSERNDRMFAVFNLGLTMNNLYFWSAYNTREVGNLLGIHLSKIAKIIPGERIHLIGAGLGAQIAGFAGKKFEMKTSKKIGRITGLDPSRPCFGNTGLDASAASFVDVIHSSKLFGSFEAKGHADFYANRISTVLANKGCESFFCLHQQAILYLAESVIPGQEKNFCALSCQSRNRFEMGYCDKNEKVFMGLITPNNARGSYYLNTNLQSPYGKCPKIQPDENDDDTTTELIPVEPTKPQEPPQPDPTKPPEPSQPDPITEDPGNKTPEPPIE